MIIGLDASRANVAQRTGTERYAFEVIRRLGPGLSGHQLRLYVREAPTDDWPTFGPNVEFRVLRWPPGILWSHLRLAWELWRRRPDVLFVPADTVPIIHPRRTVTTIHDVAFERFPEFYRSRSVQRRLGWLRPVIHALVRIVTGGRYGASERDYHRWSARHAVRASQTLLTVSEFSKREIVETLKADPRRIMVTPLGVRQPEEYQAVDLGQSRHRLEVLGLNRPFILFLGRLEAKKNIGPLIRGYLEYARHYPQPLDLVLAGQPGYGWSEVSRLAASPEARLIVHLLGWQPEETVVMLQAAARLFIFISQYEGFGLPPLESLSAGVPVLASRQGSLPEVLGECAWYTNPQSVSRLAADLHRLSTDEILRRKLIKRGRERVRLYIWDRTAELTRQGLLTAGLQKHHESGTV